MGPNSELATYMQGAKDENVTLVTWVVFWEEGNVYNPKMSVMLTCDILFCKIAFRGAHLCAHSLEKQKHWRVTPVT